MTTTASTNVTLKHSPEKSAEKKAQASLILNEYLYAAPNVIERLTQEVTTSKKEYRAQGERKLVAFDEAFEEKK